jgi:hypothetical protein
MAHNSPTATSPTSTSTPASSLGTTLTTYRGHTSYVYGVAWVIPNGERIASASLDKSVQEWNAISRSLYFSYNETMAINDVKASLDGKYIASAGQSAIAEVRDAITGASIVTYNRHPEQSTPSDSRQMAHASSPVPQTRQCKFGMPAAIRHFSPIAAIPISSGPRPGPMMETESSPPARMARRKYGMHNQAIPSLPIVATLQPSSTPNGPSTIAASPPGVRTQPCRYGRRNKLFHLT